MALDPYFETPKAENPFEYTFKDEGGENQTWTQQLFHSAAATNPFAQALMILLVSCWSVWPVNWTMYYRMFEIKLWGKDKLGIRSEIPWTLWWMLALPIFPAGAGSYNKRDLFVWLKTYSLVAGNMVIMFNKYIAGFPHRTKPMAWFVTMALSGMLWVNIWEASLWEMIAIGGSGDCYVNGINGMFIGANTFTYAYLYGTAVIERRDGLERHMRANLPFTYIMAYSWWNAKYIMTYEPEKAAWYITITLFVPILGAIFSQLDWLEIRAHLLLHALTLRVLPWDGNALFNVAMGFGQNAFLSSGLRWAFAIIALLWSFVMFYDVYRIFRYNAEPLRCGMPKGTFEINQGHPMESLREPVGEIQRRVSATIMPQVRYVAGIGQALLHHGHHNRRASAEVQAVANNPQFPSPLDSKA